MVLFESILIAAHQAAFLSIALQLAVENCVFQTFDSHTFFEILQEFIFEIQKKTRQALRFHSRV